MSDLCIPCGWTVWMLARDSSTRMTRCYARDTLQRSSGLPQIIV